MEYVEYGGWQEEVYACQGSQEGGPFHAVALSAVSFWGWDLKQEILLCWWSGGIWWSSIRTINETNRVRRSLDKLIGATQLYDWLTGVPKWHSLLRPQGFFTPKPQSIWQYRIHMDYMGLTAVLHWLNIQHLFGGTKLQGRMTLKFNYFLQPS